MRLFCSSLLSAILILALVGCTALLPLVYSENGRKPAKTELIIAAEMGDFERVKSIVASGADIYDTETYFDLRTGNSKGSSTAFDYAVSNKHLQIARYLWEKSDKKTFTRFLIYAFPNACAEYCSEKYGHNPETNLALFLASIISSEEELGIAIGRVPCVSSSKELEKLRFLRDSGVNFPANTLGCIAGRGVEQRGGYRDNRIKVAEYFLANGADPNMRDKFDGRTPLMNAAGSIDMEMVELLLRNGAKPNLLDMKGKTALTPIGCYRKDPFTQRQLEIMQLLIAHGAEITLARSGIDFGLDYLVTCCMEKDITDSQHEICRLFLQTHRNPLQRKREIISRLCDRLWGQTLMALG